VVAVECAVGVDTHPIDQNLVVSATFTHPQVASVGLTEAQAREAGHEVKVGRKKLSAVGAGVVYDDRDGLVKFVVDARTGEILGAHMFGNRACDMIIEVVATMALEGGYQELERIVHPHPTSRRRSSTRPARSTAGRSMPSRSGPTGSVRIHSRPRRSLSRRMARRLPGRRTDRLPTPGPVWRRALFDGRRAVSQGWTGAVSAGLPRRADRA
jgi:Pyridine nucleotide-disulphide oxidoreductase, dimerisation domain